jgi:hypothetical protein
VVTVEVDPESDPQSVCAQETAQVTPLLPESLVRIAEKFSVPAAVTVCGVEGLRVTPTTRTGVTVIETLADLVLSAIEVVVSVTARFAATLAGAV